MLHRYSLRVPLYLSLNKAPRKWSLNALISGPFAEPLVHLVPDIFSLVLLYPSVPTRRLTRVLHLGKSTARCEIKGRHSGFSHKPNDTPLWGNLSPRSLHNMFDLDPRLYGQNLPCTNHLACMTKRLGGNLRMVDRLSGFALGRRNSNKVVDPEISTHPAPFTKLCNSRQLPTVIPTPENQNRRVMEIGE
ncbi:hypothetical protein FA15DRAFT_666514 [Coprinopsis marcescibilis]|uniref:Uncharacterized protein n=1 Tax=Coprinopsis marcescibilis TaxID=230819 RepID=A0A5C3L376_COPMA|nr:hypothetical protein FA15DRAFT_666514 [Coprinopsis marcescibilis]